MSKKMLINTAPGQECRIAVVSDDGLEELYVERTSAASRVGNIYKARVTNVEAAIQAAFVDIGLGKNGFLHISDINPSYFPKGKRAVESVGQKRSHYYRPPIQECLRRGQEVVVQMIKEGIGTKGPTMTTYLSVPGRLLVMMPGMSKLGVSRKVEDEEARDKARAALGELNLPPDMGFIVRTAGIDRPKRELQRDLSFLLRLWKSVKQQIKRARVPSEIYQESDLVTRTIRDVYSSEIERIISDRADVARQVERFLSVAVPRSKYSVELYTGKEGLFHEAGLEEEIEKIHARRVELPMGGSLVIDQAEALVAIDVNSGRFRQHSDAETTALKINLQAAREVARQLRLRDLGGVIIIDFIDMREQKNRRQLEKTLKDALKPDRAKTKVLRTSAFGIIELTRQRLGPSLKQSYFTRCAFCDGLGMVQSEESLSLTVMRDLQRACADPAVAHIEAAVPPEVAHFLTNRQRKRIAALEAETGKTVVIRADDSVGAGNGVIECTNARGAPVAWDQPTVNGPGRPPLPTTPIADVPAPPRPKAAQAAAGAQPEAAPIAMTDIPEHAEIDFDEVEAEQAEAVDRAVSGAGQAEDAAASAAVHAVTGDGPVTGKKKRRGRRGGRKHRRRREAQAAAQQGQPQEPAQEAPQSEAKASGDAPAAGSEGDAPKKKRRRRRRRKSPESQPSQAGAPETDAQAASPSEKPGGEPKAQERPAEPAPTPEAPAREKPKPEPGEAKAEKPRAAKPKRTRRRKTAKKATAKPTGEQGQEPPAGGAEPAKDDTDADAKSAAKPKRTRRRKTAKKATAKPAGEQGQEPPAEASEPTETDAKPAAKRKTTRRRRTKKAAATVEKPKDGND